MRIAIFGAGSVGGYFGGRLAQAGQSVVFIARGTHLEAIQRDGLRVDSVAGDFVVRPAHAVRDPKEVGPVDAVLVCVKTWQLPEAAQALLPLLRPDSFIVPLENGVEAADQLASVVGPARVLPGLCRIVSSVAGPGWVRHTGVTPCIEFGELDGRPSERVAALRSAFEQTSGVSVRTPADMTAALWGKFLFIAPLSGVGAATRMPVGVIRSIAETGQLLLGAVREVSRVAEARGVLLPHDAVERTLAYIDALPPEATTSMQRDILEGCPSELDQQTGAVVRLGRAAGVAVPVNECIYRILLPMELRAREQRAASSRASLS